MLWISWERHRRTRQLAKALGAILVEHTSASPRLVRYLLLSWRTVRTVANDHPQTLIVQNPSIVLAVIGCLLKSLFGYFLVVDRHTTYLFDRKDVPANRALLAISNFTIRRADLTIVTNQPLADMVRKVGGRPFVLPDRIPDWQSDTNTCVRPMGLRCVCFICSYAKDEPYDVVFAAAAGLPADIRVYVTGRPPRAGLPVPLKRLVDSTPQLVITGFLDEEQYEGLVNCSDVVMDLTTLDNCLVCGAYEAIAAGKPLIVSEKQVNRALFGDCAVYVRNHDVASVRAGIVAALGGAKLYAQGVRALRDTYSEYWESQLALLKGELK